MAKRNKTADFETENENKKLGSKLFTVIIVFVIILVWLAIFGFIIKLDIGGLGTSLRPALKNIPVLNLVLPEVSDEQLAYEENYPYANMTEAINQIKALELQIDSLSSRNKEYETLIADLKAEVERLKVFEENQLVFEERVKEFDKNVVFNSNAPDIEEYKAYYEEINPTTAEEIYRLVLESLQYDEAIEEKAKILKTMKPSQAAAVLEEMTADVGWAAKVLLSMKPDESAAILNKMDQLYAAKLFKKMSDMDEERYNSIMSSME